MIGRLQAPGDDEENEEMLRRAIAMSLEEEEEGEEGEEVAEGVLGPGEPLKKKERQRTPNKDGYPIRELLSMFQMMQSFLLRRRRC